jgi:predicted HD phosphohydrolase
VVEKMCSHWVRPPIRNHVSSKCFARAAATCWRTVSAKKPRPLATGATLRAQTSSVWLRAEFKPFASFASSM